MLATPGRRAFQRYMMWWHRLWLRHFKRSVGGWVGKAPVLVLHSVGRKSGKLTKVPLCYLRDGDDILIGGGSGGSQRHPGWYYNLQAAPETVVDLDGVPTPMTATLLHGAERDAAWHKINAVKPLGYRYQARVEREIPVFRLTPRAN